MKAIVVDRYGGPEVLGLKDIPVPEPGADEVRVRMKAAGVNPADTYLRSGSQGYAPRLPWTPGMDGAGVVDALGEQVTGIQTGEKVYVMHAATGTYAECCICRADCVFPLPGGFDFREGAALGVPYFTAARALFTRGGACRGETVLVHGATGGVGLAALQLAAGEDVRLIGTAGSESGRRLVESFSAACYDHRDPAHMDAIVRDAGGIDLIVEMLADVNLDRDLAALAQGGRVAVVGSRGRVEIAPRDLMGIEGSVLGVRVANAGKEEMQEYNRRIHAMADRFGIRPVIAREYPLAEAQEAHRAVMEGPHAGNIILGIE